MRLPKWRQRVIVLVRVILQGNMTKYYPAHDMLSTNEINSGFKFKFFDSLLKLASGFIFYLLNLSANLLFHTYKHC